MIDQTALGIEIILLVLFLTLLEAVMSFVYLLATTALLSKIKRKILKL
jgi:hypothetical protein